MTPRRTETHPGHATHTEHGVAEAGQSRSAPPFAGINGDKGMSYPASPEGSGGRTELMSPRTGSETRMDRQARELPLRNERGTHHAPSTTRVTQSHGRRYAPDRIANVTSFSPRKNQEWARAQRLVRSRWETKQIFCQPRGTRSHESLLNPTS